MGRAPAVGALAARHADPAVPRVLLRGAGHLPAGRRAGRQHRGAGSGPDLVPGLHARGDRGAVGHRWPAARAAGRVFRRRAVRRGGPGAAPGGVRHLRRHVGVPRRARDMVRGPGRPAAGGDRLDARGRSRAGAGQRHGVLLGPVRPGGDRGRAAHRVPPARRQARGRARPDPADRGGRGAHRGIAGRRELLRHRRAADHGAAGGRRAVPAHRARPFLAVDRAHHRHRLVRRHHQLGRAGRARADLAAGRPGQRRGAGTAGASPPAHRGLAEQAPGPGRLVRRHRRGLPTGPTRTASPRYSPRSPNTAPGTCSSKTPPSRSTTCPPAATGSDGPAPATSSCPQEPAPAAPPAPPASPAPATPASSPSTSPPATSPSSH